MLCSCKFRNRFGIDCPHVYHVVCQSQEFKEPTHHHISVRWWNSFYQFACMSKNDKQFEALEKAIKILLFDEKDGLPVEAKWFNHLPIHNEKDLPLDFETSEYPKCLNYTFLKVEPEEMDLFENNPFSTNFSQDIQKYDEIETFCEEEFFENLFQDDDKNNIGLTNKLSPYSMLIDAFKEMTSHLEGNWTNEVISEIRLFFTKIVTESKKKTKESMKGCSNMDKHSIVSVTLPSSKRRKTHGTKHY